MDLGAAIGVAGWFIQVVFDKYITLVLEKWASDVGLNEEYKHLTNKLEYIKLVLVSAQGGKKIQNNELVKYIQKVQYLVYQAENLLDEMQYYRLQREVESRSDYSDDVASSSASQVSVSVFSKLKSYNPLYKNDDAETSASKRKIDEDHGLVRNKRTKFQRDDLSRRIRIMVEKLEEVGKNFYKALKLEKLDQNVRVRENTIIIQPLKSSHLAESRVFGRDEEREFIIGQLIGDNFANSNLSILPVLGHGGVGKTTLARLVFTDTRIEEYFELRMWIHVSMVFDEDRIIRELLEFVPKEKRNGVENKNMLLENLKKFLSIKRFLVVLDDVWEDNDKSKWERLRSLLESEGKNGSVILLTTRKLSVVKIVGEKNMIKLDGLKENDFWDLFRSYALNDENHENYKILHKIGKEICNKLSKYPLEAKTVGAMLKKNSNIIYWKNVRDNEEWKSQNGPDDIMPALRLSYEALPFHLQKCFSFCSLFPKGFKFIREDIVNIWIAQGFICPNNSKMRDGDIENIYLDNLVHSGFFDRVKKFRENYYYVIHDLMHDLAQNVSEHECFTIDNSPGIMRGPADTIRHLSIITETFDPLFMFDGSNLPCGNFEKNLVEIQNHLEVENLSTLIIIGRYNSDFNSALKTFLHKLKGLRVLMILIMPHEEDLLTCNFSEFIHLRYLQLNGLWNKKTFSRDLPNDLNKLYQLEVLDLRNWVGSPKLPKNMDSLVGLRYIHPRHNESLTNIERVGNLTGLQKLTQFRVKKESGFEITQLGSLMYLENKLEICNLENVESKEESAGAGLEQKSLLNSLYLRWDEESGDAQLVNHADVLEGLKPNSNLERLKISGYGGVFSPTWLANDCVLDYLVSLVLENCIAWEILPPLGNLLSLKKLTLRRISAVKEINSLFYGNGVDMGFQALEEMKVSFMPELERWMGCDGCQAFPCLKSLTIENCPKLVQFLPLEFVSFGNHSKNWFLCFSDLTIRECPSLKYLYWEGLHELVNLERLIIEGCPDLFSSFRPNERDIQISFLSQSLETLEISSCDITGKQLSYLLSNQHNLYQLVIEQCCRITSLVVESRSNVMSSYLTSCHPLVHEGLLQIPFSLRSTLEELIIRDCPDLVFTSNQGLGELTSIELLELLGSPNLFSYLVSGEEIDGSSLLPPTVKDLSLNEVPDKTIYSLLAPLTSLLELSISECPQLLSLQIPLSCAALRTLSVEKCEIMASLVLPLHLERSYMSNCPSMVSLNYSMATRPKSPNSEFIPSLNYLSTDNTKLLSYPNCKQLSALKTLKFVGEEVVDLTEEQEKALPLLTSLNSLEIVSCPNLKSLPNQLCNLSSLKYLEIFNCRGIKSLPQNGLPASLKKLSVFGCSDELNRQCNNITSIE